MKGRAGNWIIVDQFDTIKIGNKEVIKDFEEAGEKDAEIKSWKGDLKLLKIHGVKKGKSNKISDLKSAENLTITDLTEIKEEKNEES